MKLVAPTQNGGVGDKMVSQVFNDKIILPKHICTFACVLILISILITYIVFEYLKYTKVSNSFPVDQNSYNCSACFVNLLWPQFQKQNSHSLQKGTPSIYPKYACLSFLMANLVLAQCELQIVILFPVFARKILQTEAAVTASAPNKQLKTQSHEQ